MGFLIGEGGRIIIEDKNCFDGREYKIIPQNG